MPAKYREMADFYEYYSGARIAPVLTVFVGGNHEASNHLYELYYGGWVAPNIYYMGAANVLQIGNLRIAGMSGIWKGYDYRRPHFERLPYNNDEMYGIYHVRELDVRKLLAIRSQVDIGISHDWPQTVEWSGNYEWLFKKKDRFQWDAENSRLGSVAAKYVLDRLRPNHWFSAHLHIRYEATYDHNDPKGIQTKDGKPLTQVRDKKQLSAWHGFEAAAKQTDADEQRQFIAAQEQRRKKQEEDGTKDLPAYVFNETFKKVTMGDNLRRHINVEEAQLPTREGLPQLDGSCGSRPSKSLKRQREVSGSPEQQTGIRSPRFVALNTPMPRDVALNNPTQESILTQSAVVAKNPDELDLNLTDDEIETTKPPTNPIPIGMNPDAIELDLSDEEDTPSKPYPRASSPFPFIGGQAQSRRSDLSEDGGAVLSASAANFVPRHDTRKSSQDSARSSLDVTARDFVPKPDGALKPRKSTESDLRPEAEEFHPSPPAEQNGGDHEDENAIPDDIRAELAELSKNFAPPVQIEVSEPLPFPEEISNKTTHFLALDKCLPGRHFLELLEIDSLSNPIDADMASPIERPIKLKYDPEWLAILRAFASELETGGDREDRVAIHRGDTYYDERILEERKWVFEHITMEGKLEVPDNFTITAPIYDANQEVKEEEMPREVTNPQTVAFCTLLGIDNHFDATEEDRDARILAGPKPVGDHHANRRGGRNRGGGGRGGGGRGGGRGGKGGRGGRGGGGRGRGRGGRGFYTNY